MLASLRRPDIDLAVKTSPSGIYQFGPFQVNPASGELRKQGERVRLQDQPFRLLVILVENAGQVVTREELQKQIWQSDTFVDFDSSLRVAVRKLREALGDDAESPRYIETIPKRGYRFLGPAIPLAAESQQVLPAPGEAPGTREPDSTPAAPEKTTTPRIHYGRWALAAVALVVIAGWAAKLLWPHKQKVLTAKDTVVLADFVNSTGDPVFDETLQQGLVVQLEQSPFLSLISEDRAQQELRLMGQPAGVRITPSLADEICVRTGSAATLEGSIARLGSQYVLGLRAKDCRNGATFTTEQAQAARKEDVLNALSQIARKFRTEVGESLATVEERNTPLVEATTPSLDALKIYSEGWKVAHTEGDGAAIPFFKRATEIDSTFAMAYSALGLMYGSTGESDLAAEYTQKAYGLRGRVNDRERFFITAYYDGRATGNQERAMQTCETWTRAYPRQNDPYLFLAGFIYPVLGKFEKGVAAGEKAIELNPDVSIAYVNLGFNLIALGRLEEAERVLRRASERKLEVPLSLLTQYDIAFLRDDQPEMERIAARALGSSEAEDWMFDHLGAALAYVGRLREARMMSQHAVDLARQAGHNERAALFETRAALREAFFGNTRAAEGLARQALKLAKDREVQYGAAFAMATAGDSARAEALADDLEKRFPEDTSVRVNYLPALRARLALNHGEPLRALEQLRPAEPNELGMPRSAINGYFGAMYPIYASGEAHLAAHHGAESAAEFQKILDHRGIVLSDPIGALAHLQRARALLMSGDKVGAKAAYQDFLSLWKSADPDLPILRQAKAEYIHDIDRPHSQGPARRSTE